MVVFTPASAPFGRSFANKNAGFYTKSAFFILPQKALFHGLFGTFQGKIKPFQQSAMVAFFAFEGVLHVSNGFVIVKK